MPLDVIFIGAYSLTTFGGGVKWFINLLNLLQIDGRVRPHLFVQDNVDYGRINQHDIEEMVNFDYQEIRHASGQLLPRNFSSASIETVYTMTDRPQILQKAKELGACRVIFGAHDPYLLLLKGKKRRLFEEVWRRVTAIHILSPEQVAFSRYNSNLFPLPNTWFGCTIPRPKKFSKFTVLFFSRHEVDKGFDIVQQVARTLPEDIDLYVVGSGTRISRVRASNVHVLGFIPETELYSLIERSHVILFPSRRESGLSMVAVEALAHHTPLVYRDMAENWILKKHRLNFAVDRDAKFLCGLEHLKNMYQADRSGYLEQCSQLPSLLESRKSYVENFVKMLSGGPGLGLGHYYDKFGS